MGNGNLTTHRYTKARRIVDLAVERGVLDQARTYTDMEWRELGRQAGWIATSDETISLCRLLVVERTEDPFRGIA
jgi:hypothetical protein